MPRKPYTWIKLAFCSISQITQSTHNFNKKQVSILINYTTYQHRGIGTPFQKCLSIGLVYVHLGTAETPRGGGSGSLSCFCLAHSLL